MKAPVALDQLLKKPMDRKDFLRHTAVITLFLAGGGVIVQSLLKGFKFGQVEQQAGSAGSYGASVYGGTKVRTQQK